MPDEQHGSRPATEAGGSGSAGPAGRAPGRRPIAGLRHLRFADPGLVALRNAVRAAIVLPIVFAFAERVIGDPRVSVFASFGSFAILVFADFAGPPLRRLAAYLGLTCAGALFITVGTLCSRDARLAAAAMAVTGFVTLFAGMINGYFAAAAFAAILTFVLPVMLPAPASAIPARLEGWLLAAAAGISAQLLLWPGHRRTVLRRDAARACAALADLAEAGPDGGRAVAERTGAAEKAVDRLRRGFAALPHRPSGLTGPAAALGSLVDEFEWLLSFLATPDGTPRPPVCEQEHGAAIRASAGALRASAAVLAGGTDRRPDLMTLHDARDALTFALARRLPDLPAIPDHEALMSALEPAFRARAVSYAAQNAARYALLVEGTPEAARDRGRRARLRAWARAAVTTARTAVEDADIRSIWFRNSVRGAVGLALAVYIAQRTGLQHSFWIVLGTFSVLRSNALGTGWSVLSAVAGTGVGILAGSLLIVAIGTHPVVLGSVLPVAVLLAAYVPRAISFAAGQAGFNVVTFVLFNIVEPSGWRIGLVRIEDVAIGFAISLGVGLLFWPRGAARLLRENLAAAYARGADDVLAATRLIIGRGDRDRAERAAQDADAALHRLDDAFRQYLTERSAHPVNRDSVATLVTGAARLRRTGRSLAHLSTVTGGHPVVERYGAGLDAEVSALRSWYVALGDCLVHCTDVPPPQPRDDAARRRLLEGAHAAVTSGAEDAIRAALVLLWAGQYVDMLWQMEAHLRRHAAANSTPM